MSSHALYFCCLFAAALPFWAIGVLLCQFFLSRAVWKCKQGLGKKHLGFCPSASALGMALLFMQVFIRPSLQQVLEEKQEEDADDDDQGEPESPEKLLSRQLRRIRRGEQVGDLSLRL